MISCFWSINCYFSTHFGVMQQTCGFPMGGHSSREILDIILLASEYRILSVMECCPFYQRMVDDISCVFTCGIEMVKFNLELSILLPCH